MRPRGTSGDNKTGAAVLAVRRQLAWERYWDGFGPHSRFDTYSAVKAFTATAIGLLMDDGKLKIVRRARPCCGGRC